MMARLTLGSVAPVHLCRSREAARSPPAIRIALTASHRRNGMRSARGAAPSRFLPSRCRYVAARKDHAVAATHAMVTSEGGGPQRWRAFMTIRSEIRAARDQWRLLTVYEKFEQAVVLILITLIAVIVAAAVLNLMLTTVSTLMADGLFNPDEFAVFHALFGMIFTVIIALEFRRSIHVVSERRESIVQVRTVVLVAMLAILRKMIILDLNTTDAGKVIALSVAIVALGAVYWLARE